MEIEAFVCEMKSIHEAFLDFIDASDESSDDECDILLDILEKQDILQSKEKMQLLFQLISKIIDNHHLPTDFYNKLEKIFQYLTKNKQSSISNYIPDCSILNKRLYYFLLEKRFIEPSKSFISQYLQKRPDRYSFLKDSIIQFQSFYYLYPVLKKFINEKIQKEIDDEIFKRFNEDFISFEKKCQAGQNDSYICSLIREDSVEEFIAYVNRNNLSLLSKINKSIFETNSFLCDNGPTLIEYATFYGSIQIIQYLKYNQVPLTGSLWLYAIHSNNAELIHFLEENKVKPKKKTYSFYSIKSCYNEVEFDDVFIESIKCHHNNIAVYIKDNLLQIEERKDQNLFTKINSIIKNSLNLYFYPDDINDMICKSLDIGNINFHDIYGLCSSITTITIPSSVTSINDSVFQGCLSLKQVFFVNLSSEASIENQVKCLSLTEKAFQNDLLETSIGEQAFYECLSLIQITISSSATSIGQYAFCKCSSLKKITIPSYITSIGKFAFNGCLSLTQIDITSPVISTDHDDFCEYASLEPKTITTPPSLLSIGNYAFCKCSLLKQITILSYIISIGNYAFYGCLSLEQIGMPSSQILIGHDDFYESSLSLQLKNLSSLSQIGSYAFYACSSLKQITIPSSVTSIGFSAFCGCALLTQITIPPSVTLIHDQAFYDCSSLTKIEIPSSVTHFGKNVFNGIKTFKITGNIKHISNKLFDGLTSLIKITIPTSVISIGDHSFYKCTSLEQILFGNHSSLVSIGLAAFCGCSSLTQITIPSSVTSIGQSAFYDCSSLKNVIFENPSSLISIGKYAFNNCPLLPPELIKLIKK